MKSWSIMLTAIFLLFLTSSIPTDTTDATIGNTAPLFALKSDKADVELQSLKGEYVLVNFWSLEDAQSRIDNVRYDRMAKKLNNRFRMISINLDNDYELYNKIIEIDGLEKSGQFNSKDVVYGELRNEWHLKNGNRAYLINPNGKIMAINPNENQLTELI